MDLEKLTERGQLPGLVENSCRLEIPVDYPDLLFNPNAPRNFLHYALPRLHLQMALIFLITQSIHFFFKRYYMPRFISEIMAGLILGPTIMGRLIPNFTATLFPEDGDVLLELLSKIGFIFYMFLIGVKMDPFMVSKSGTKGLVIGSSLVALPALVGYSYSALVIDKKFPHYRRPPAGAVMAANTIIPFPVIANLLIDLQIMNSELGRLALTSGLIGMVITSFMYNIAAILWLKETGWNLAFTSSVLSLTLMLVIIFVMRPLALLIIKQTSEGRPVKRFYIACVACVVLVVALASDNTGLQYHFGPFVLGLIVPDGPPLGSTLVERWETIVTGLFAPLMVTYCALKVDLFVLYDLQFVGVIWQIISVMFVFKFVAVFASALLCKVPVRDALALSLVMNIQGVVEMAIYNDIYKNQVLDGETFSTVTLSVLIIAPLVTLLVRLIHDDSYTYQGYENRSISYSAYNADLRVLACIHRHDDTVAIIKLLEISSPTKVSSIAIYALNLVELVGRATPLLLNHSLGQKSISRRAQQMIDSFQYLERRFPGTMTTQCFTTVSLPRFMHHDICTLAFDKLTSLIILPFHKKWNQYGQIIFDSGALRAINRHVMDMAPCSVAILIDRRKIRHRSSRSTSSSGYHVGVLFLGGNDDREALAYGKRMASSPGVYLTVIRLMGPRPNHLAEEPWDTILDTEALKEIKMMSSHQHESNLVYREEKVKDGPGTVAILDAMEEAFDLILVGLGHREDSPFLSGLIEWSDFPELGTVGDLLASSDVKRPVSVLVVQHQVLRKK